MALGETSPFRLYLIQLETTTIPVPGGRYGMVVCYLIQTRDGKNILVDSGIAADAAAHVPAAAPPTPGNDVLARLQALGIAPGDVDLLVCTHFDPDHAGYHDAFAGAELIVQRAHLTAARAGHPRFAPTRAHWDHPALRYRVVDGDTELVPGITLLETSGHAPGHQSLLVRLPRTGPVLLAGDAVALERLFTPDRHAWPLDDDEAHLRASTRKLLDLVAREHVGLVVFGHDADQWATLKQAPDYYD